MPELAGEVLVHEQDAEAARRGFMHSTVLSSAWSRRQQAGLSCCRGGASGKRQFGTE
jgi:hypothetical protein